MTRNKIMKKLQDGGFNMAFVVECSRDYLEVFDGDPLDYDGNEHIRDEAMKLTGMKCYLNIAYGGWMISNTPFTVDSNNNQ